MNAFIIFPTTLYENIKISDSAIFIVEEPIYFTKFAFHKQKLVLHRASMKFYYDYLTAKKYDVQYIEYDKMCNFYKNLRRKYKNISCYDPIDHTLRKKLRGIKLLNNNDNLYSNDYKGTLRHDEFYKWQRKRLNILMNGESPAFGKWSFDSENRHPFDDKYIPPKNPPNNENKYVIEAKSYVLRNFPRNFGDLDNFEISKGDFDMFSRKRENEFIWPVTFMEAKNMFKRFLATIDNFGHYQDSISSKISFGSHSLLSSSLNIGLITPRFIIDNLPTATSANINSIEAFVRQLIGWRCYTRFWYENFKMTGNVLKHKYKLSKKWYTGGILKPIDNMIDKVKKYAYLHHIERLMIVGNMFLLLQTNPDEVYKWFMIVSIDSYEWVMMSNVYCMSQYSSKKMMMTRPYFSSSNYLRKMSSGLLDDKSISVWNALYYNFVNKHSRILSKNYMTASSVKYWKKMSKKEKSKLLSIARMFLRKMK